MTAPFPLPEGVIYDGPMQGIPRVLHMFTDTETKSSFGVFGVAPSVDDISKERDSIREGYAKAKRAEAGLLPPIYQRAPRVFTSPETNHFK